MCFTMTEKVKVFDVSGLNEQYESVENIMYYKKIQHVRSRKVSIYQVEYWKLAKYIKGVKRSQTKQKCLKIIENWNENIPLILKAKSFNQCLIARPGTPM